MSEHPPQGFPQHPSYGQPQHPSYGQPPGYYPQQLQPIPFPIQDEQGFDIGAKAVSRKPERRPKPWAWYAIVIILTLLFLFMVAWPMLQERKARDRYREYWEAVYKADRFKDFSEPKEFDTEYEKAQKIWIENRTLFRSYGFQHEKEARALGQ